MSKPSNNITSLVLTIMSEDRPGIVSTVAETVRNAGGNWLESELSSLRGYFAGVVFVDIQSEKTEQLSQALKGLAKQNIDINIHSVPDNAPTSEEDYQYRVIEVEANDREGIIEEITEKLSAQQVNVEHMETRCESAAMAGYDLFFATLHVRLPNAMNSERLEKLLESVSDDLMVNVLQEI